MTAGYSALFSAGLLAPSHNYTFPKTPSKSRDGIPRASGDLRIRIGDRGPEELLTPYGDTSPIRPISPLPCVSSDSDVEMSGGEDDDVDMDSEDTPHKRPGSRLHDKSSKFQRDATPTQQSVRPRGSSTSSGSSSNSFPSTSHAPNASTTGTAPRLRKRRSSLSLTVNISPMNAIRSPMRTAGAALQLQRHLGSRSRSGSVTAGTASLTATANANGGLNVTTILGGTVTAPPTAMMGGMFNVDAAGLMGRLRSGSVGSRPVASAVPGRVRRHVRRITSVPAPLPPPTAPLPALPPLPGLPSLPPLSILNTSSSAVRAGPRTPLTFQNTEPSVNPSKSPGYSGTATKPKIPTRDRGLSVGSSVERIDEEMKEN